MTANRFVDTNVLLYAVSTAPDEADKAEAARAVLESRDLGLSVQVLQEFYVQATRSTRPDPLDHDRASALVEAFARFPVQALDLDIVRAALDTRDRFRISYGMQPFSRRLGGSAVRSCFRKISRMGRTSVGCWS